MRRVQAGNHEAFYRIGCWRIVGKRFLCACNRYQEDKWPRDHADRAGLRENPESRRPRNAP